VRFWCCTAALVLVLSASAAAEVQLKPLFIGVTFGGSTTLSLGAEGAATPALALGIGAAWLGELFGIEGEIAHYPGFFEPNSLIDLVSSGATTYTGNLIVAVPREKAKYTLRPYFVVGGGLMRANIQGPGEGVLPIESSLAAIDIGGGVTGFVSHHVGLNWDIRHFGSVGGDRNSRNTLGEPEQLSFWRAHMALVIRF